MNSDEPSGDKILNNIDTWDKTVKICEDSKPDPVIDKEPR